ncbi:MAG: aminotransferase class V-fold PLP-dependent enzyme [Ectothiorhodospiraceae bacterium]|nr:aminotransferase class V-fold PLP-dependent enzyme [Ectothiorhodospiraceae bacterium]
MIYLDHAASTPLDPRAAEAMWVWMQGDGALGNPSSTGHRFGRQAADAVEQARREVAGLVNADPAGIVWTSGATEANNLALLGACRFAGKRGRGRHLVSCRTEHKAVLEACAQLEREGFELSLLEPAPDGSLDPARVLEAVRDDTVLVSLMHANNETGVVHDIPVIAGELRGRPVLLHVDAAQSAGRLPVDAAGWGIDLLSLSGHKLHGPKGVGALYVRPRPRLRLEPLLFGGGQERGYRPGTLPVHQIVGMGRAFALAADGLEADAAYIRGLRDRLWDGFNACGGVLRNGREDGAPHILNVAFVGVHGEALAEELQNLAISAGAACSSADATTSHVLRAMGVPDGLALSSFRFSVARTTTAQDVDAAVAQVRLALRRLRAFSPVWRRFRQGVSLTALYGRGNGFSPNESKGVQ